MVSQKTEGISISVETFYLEEQSTPQTNEFAFAYRIKIHNESEKTIKLLRRHWYVVDSSGFTKEVEGEGVVGEQPLLEPLEAFTYTSAASIKSDIGRMYGYYVMLDITNHKEVKVDIPSFNLIPPFKYN